MAEQRTRRPHGPMGGSGRGMMPGEKPKDFKNSIEKLVRYLGRYWYAIVAVMIFAAVSTVFSVAGPKVMARATNALVEGLGKRSREPDLLILPILPKCYCLHLACISVLQYSVLYRE